MRHPSIFALLPALLLCALPTLSSAAVDVSLQVSFAPPVIPVYEEPPLPAPGYLFVPGYWAWDGTDYYWVPGTWVEPPINGLLWTPGYWSYQDGFYVWTDGYWGPDVGFYGGVNYGFGYTGVGYQGGYWHGGAFFYNRAVHNFGRANVVNVYTAPVQVHEVSRVSFNGGQGGLHARPTPAERHAMAERHRPPTGLQMQQRQNARAMPELHARQNGGRPRILSTVRAGDFAHPGPGARPGLHNREPGQFRGGAGAEVGQGPGPQPHENPAPQLQQHGPFEPQRPQGPQREQSQPHESGQHREPAQREQFQPQREPVQQAEPRAQFQPRETGQQREPARREQVQPQREPVQQAEPRPQFQPHEAPAPHEAPLQHEAPPPHEALPQREPAPRVNAPRPPEARPAEPHGQSKHEDDRKDH